ncbi:MAG: hypothetical protein J6Q92_06055 [Oscillospiraceae bacterium]|nr:hypothetical protein [Oscillospiraceae bacterium]
MYFDFCRSIIVRELYCLKTGGKRHYDLTIPRLIAKEEKKPLFLVWLRMVLSVVVTGCTFQEYYNLKFAQRTIKNQKTFITTGSNLKAYKKLNDEAYYHLYINKDEFNKTYSQFIGRDWIQLCQTKREQIYVFFRKHCDVIVKPRSGDSGKGIFIVHNSNQMTTAEIDELIQRNEQGIVEELLRNHPKLDELNASSLNTMRVVTVRNGATVKILFAGIRFGAEGKEIDNISMGGRVAPIDPVTGTICGHSHSKKTVNTTDEENENYVGFQMPMWDDLQTYLLGLTAVVPQMRYMAWDIAITPKGFVTIEGNHSSGNTVTQAHIGTKEQGLRVNLIKWVT